MTDVPAPPANRHGDHEANCLCCKKVTLGVSTDAEGWAHAAVYCDAGHFWAVLFGLWHDEIIRARTCPDFEERE